MSLIFTFMNCHPDPERSRRGRTCFSLAEPQTPKGVSMKARPKLFLVAASTLAALSLQAQTSITYDPAQFAGLHYRNVGPWRGGRVTTVTGVPTQPNTFYMGTVGGGVWKTTDAGHTWLNTTDGQISVGSMGAVAVADSDPNTVYAGTGSSKIRSNVSHRPRHLQVHRRRQNLALPRPTRRRPDQHGPNQPHQPRRGLRSRARQPLRR